MKKVIYKSTAIQFIILLAAVIILSTLWPMRLWKKDVTLSVTPRSGTFSEYVDKDKIIRQTFLSQGTHLERMRLYIGEGSQGEFFYARMYDEKYQLVAEEEVQIPTEGLPCYVEMPMDLDMEKDKTYFFTLQGVDLVAEARQGEEVRVCFAYEMIAPDELPGAGIMYYNEEQIYGAGIVADYVYSTPIGMKRTLACMVGILLVALCLMAVVRWLFRKVLHDSLTTVEQAVRAIANPCIVAGTVAGLVTIAMGRWTSYAADSIFYMVAVILLGAVLFYGVNHNRDGQGTLLTGDFIREHLADGLQILFIAGAIAACCDYMNGLYEIHHQVAQRREMLFFALVILTMFSWKELVNRYTLLYVIIAGIAGAAYYHNGLNALMVREFKVESEIGMNVEVLRNTVLIAILFGFILLRTLICLCKRKLAKPNYWYGVPALLFFAGIVIFRNTRWWTVVLAVSFTLLYLSYGMWEHRSRFLTNVLYGVVFHFILSLIYALLHRPYGAYEYARYPFTFHTVTTTATYLVIVECAVIVLLFGRLRQSSRLRDVWKELCLFGIVTSYMLFTMSRTGLFTAGVVGIIAWLIMTDGKGKNKLKKLGYHLGLVVAAVIVMFPITFTAQRNVPILASEPRKFEIENWHNKIMREHNFTSTQYISIGRFAEVFLDKVFSIPEGTFDFYGEDEKYRTLYMHNEAAGEQLVASLVLPSAFYSEPDAVPYEETESSDDYSNGRMTIFRSYLEQLNADGHDTMGAVLPDGEIAVHAHDIYLQVAFDHGMGVGILFLLFGAATLLRAVFYYRKNKAKPYAAFPLLMTISFAVAGTVEWIFHLSNPCTLVLMMVIAPLLYKDNAKVEE